MIAVGPSDERVQARAKALTDARQLVAARDRSLASVCRHSIGAQKTTHTNHKESIITQLGTVD